MEERSLCMREVRGSIPCVSRKPFFGCVGWREVLRVFSLFWVPALCFPGARGACCRPVGQQLERVP